MNCPSSYILEDFVAGRLDPQQESRLLGHLSECSSCSKEITFLKAVCQVAPKLSASQDCLSDEILCAFADGALQDHAHQKILSHLSLCDNCSANLANLARALDESVSGQGHPLIKPPVALLNRAIRIGASGRSASEKKQHSKRFSQLFKGNFLPWRMAFAGLVAGAVLILVTVVSVPVPGPAGHEDTDSGLKAWRADHLAASDKPKEPKAEIRQPTVAATPAGSGQGQDTSTLVVDKRDKGLSSKKTRSSSAGSLASLSLKQRAVLAASLAPADLVPSISSSRAFTGQSNRSADGYAIGRALEFLRRFGGFAMESSELRLTTAKVLSTLLTHLHGAGFEGKDGKRVVDFISSLAEDLESDKIEASTASLRIKVLCQALKDTVDVHKDMDSGVRLGVLVQGWSSDKLTAKRPAPIDGASALKRARKIISSDVLLSDQIRQAALVNIQELERSAKIENPALRTQRIIEKMQKLGQTMHNQH